MCIITPVFDIHATKPLPPPSAPARPPEHVQRTVGSHSMPIFYSPFARCPADYSRSPARYTCRALCRACPPHCSSCPSIGQPLTSVRVHMHQRGDAKAAPLRALCNTWHSEGMWAEPGWPPFSTRQHHSTNYSWSWGPGQQIN